MRLAGQQKAGFFPYTEDGIRDIARLLTPPPGRPWTLLDPCCGEGKALKALADATGCKESDLYAVELEDVRTERARELMPDARLVGPASFLEVDAEGGRDRLSAAWVNPPYDDEMGGGFRVETSFAARVTQLLQPGGLLLLAVPERIVAAKGEYVTGYQFELSMLLATRYENAVILLPRPEHRPYKEVVIAATKRKRALFKSDVNLGADTLPEKIDVTACGVRWAIPAGGPLPKWEKGGFTEKELYAAVAESPLWRLTDAPPERPPAEPLLPLAKGHLAMMLASGFLDGVVRPEGERPHVVRGTVRKEFGDPQVSEEHDPDKGVTKTTVRKSQKIVISVRTADESGNLKTLE